MIKSGTIIGERFRLEACLGEGGFGEVWQAIDLKLEPRKVAVKFLKTPKTVPPSLIERFNMEALALSTLNHPNIVSIVDRGKHNEHEYIVMELLLGMNLSDWIDGYRVRGAWPESEKVFSIFDQIASAVEVAHLVQKPGPIIHRDIKPGNVFLIQGHRTEDLHVKVVDFGLAQLGKRVYTPTGAILGTPAYMAPEQALGAVDATSPATDIFSMGVVLVELLTLETQPPSQAPWWLEAARANVQDPEIFNRMRPNVPQGIWDIVMRALSTRPEERFQTAGEMRTALNSARRKLQKPMAENPRVAIGRLDRLMMLQREAEHCDLCQLCSTRQRSAFSRGGFLTKVLFLGEAPGVEEDRTGIPFSGPAGELVDRIIAAMRLSVDDVYLTNIIKCKCPGCRNPLNDELTACRKFWTQQIELTAPKVIVTLGIVASQTVLNTKETISTLRGRWHEYRGIPTMPTFHPAFLLRNPEAKKSTWADMKMVMEQLEQTMKR